MASQIDKSALLQSIAARNGESDICLASERLRALQACLAGTGPCSPEMFGEKSLDSLDEMLKTLDGKLSFESSETIIGDLGTKGSALSPGSILDFDCIVTASSMDRDRDVLKSAGAILDPAAPLLLYHDPQMPIGRLVSKIAQNDRLLSARCCVFNTALGRDAATLIEGGALRISHGFDPLEYEPLKNGRYLISKFEIYEISCVPIPSNPAAVITAFSRGKLFHPFVKSFAKRMFDDRTVMVKGHSFDAPAEPHVCTCQKNKEAPVSEPLNKGQGEAADSTAPKDSLVTTTGWTNTSAEFEDNEGNRGQGPQQGDHDWHERHMANEVVDEEVAGLDRPAFQLDNTQEGDPVFAIASGSNTGPQQNPAPDTALAGNVGNADETMPPGVGVRFPVPTNPSTNPGVQRSATPTAKDVNDSSYVQPLDSDSAAHHDVAGNVNTHVDVDVPHLKAMARVIQHSGKEGSVYLNAAKGYVHHVMHPDDVHPDNAHMYHSPDQIQKAYACCHGVMGTKCVVGMHPGKGSGYSLVHKGMKDGDADISGLTSASAVLKEIHGYLALVYSAPDSQVSKAAKQNIHAAGTKLVGLLKTMDFVNPTYSGVNNAVVPPVQGVPADNAINATAAAHFSGVPAQNVPNEPSMNHFPGIPEENKRGPDDANAIAGSNVTAATLPKSTPAAGVTNIAPSISNRPRTDPDIASGVDGINTSESLSEMPIDPDELMEWLEGREEKSADELEFEAMMVEHLFEEVGV